MVELNATERETIMNFLAVVNFVPSAVHVLQIDGILATVIVINDA